MLIKWYQTLNNFLKIFLEADVTTNKILQLIAEDKIMESQIFSVHWLRNDELVACGSNGILKIFSFTMEGVWKKYDLIKKLIRISMFNFVVF